MDAKAFQKVIEAGQISPEEERRSGINFLHYPESKGAKMTTELVWSTVKPTFEEVKGKNVKLVWDDGKQKIKSEEYFVDDLWKYEHLFDDEFICYADLTAPVSPLPLWGKTANIVVHSLTGKYYAIYEHHDWSILTPDCDTRELAILAWNRIAEALNEVEK